MSSHQAQKEKRRSIQHKVNTEIPDFTKMIPSSEQASGKRKREETWQAGQAKQQQHYHHHHHHHHTNGVLSSGFASGL
jgi:hypothetical protein